MWKSLGATGLGFKSLAISSSSLEASRKVQQRLVFELWLIPYDFLIGMPPRNFWIAVASPMCFNTHGFGSWMHLAGYRTAGHLRQAQIMSVTLSCVSFLLDCGKWPSKGLCWAHIHHFYPGWQSSVCAHICQKRVPPLHVCCHGINGAYPYKFIHIITVEKKRRIIQLS